MNFDEFVNVNETGETNNVKPVSRGTEPVQLPNGLWYRILVGGTSAIC